MKQAIKLERDNTFDPYKDVKFNSIVTDVSGPLNKYVNWHIFLAVIKDCDYNNSTTINTSTSNYKKIKYFNCLIDVILYSVRILVI